MDNLPNLPNTSSTSKPNVMDFDECYLEAAANEARNNQKLSEDQNAQDMVIELKNSLMT